MSKTIGVLALARPTFDVPFAEEMAAKAFAKLEASGHNIVGSGALLFDAEATEKALAELKAHDLDLVLLLQVTFTDATMTVAVASAFDAPLAIWAIPEPRSGGRLRLNAFCGLNLAAHALGLNDHPFSYLYADPERASSDADIADLLAGNRTANEVKPTAAISADAVAEKAKSVVKAIDGSRIARLGAHPDGFDTCAYDEDKLRALAGVEVDAMELDTLFDKAKLIPENEVAETRALAERDLGGLDEVDQVELDRSLRLKNALDEIRGDGKYSAFAIRCWPETFTEYGGAVCGPVSMMGEKRVPCACEADIYGALTSMILQEVADSPAFQVDLVDIDQEDGTGVIWHCGQAPISMADKTNEPAATIHTNRKMPLLYEFTLKPGRVTFARVSQSRGETKLVIAGGEMLRRPMSFTGTSGVVAYDAGPQVLLETVMGAALEHHTCLVYGDYRSELRAIAAELDIPVLEIA